MADEVGESLKLNIKITSTGEKKLQTIAESVATLEKSLGSVTTQLKAFGTAVSSIDTSGLNNAKKAMNGISKATDEAAKAANSVQDPLKAAGDAANDVANNTKKAGNAAKKAGTDGEKSANKLGNSFDKLLKSIGRVAFYRAIRTLIKGITDGFKTGIQNLARYSSEANASMSKLATASLYIKNSVGAAAMPIIEQMLPALLKLANYAVKALNAINQLMSALQGKSTYTRAKEYAVDYAATLDKSTSNASKSVQKLKRDLMGFDELNVLSAPDTGASAGGGGEDYSQMFEEAEISKEFEKAAKVVEKLKENLDVVLGIVGAIGAGIAAWRLSNFLFGLDEGITKAEMLKKSLSFAAGVTLTVIGITLLIKGIKSIKLEGINAKNFAETLSGALAITGGGALIGKAFGGAVLGTSIGAIIGGAAAIAGGLISAFSEGINGLNSWLIAGGSTLAGAGVGALIGSLGGPIGAGVGALAGLVIGIVVDLGIALAQNWDDFTGMIDRFLKHIVALPKKVWEEAVSAAKNIKDGFLNAWGGEGTLWDKIKASFWAIVDGVKQFFGIASPSKVMSELGSYVTEGFFGGIKEKWDTMVSNVSEKLTKLKETFSEKVNDIKQVFHDWWDKLSSWWNSLSLGQLKLKSPHFEWTTQPAEGWIAKVLSAINLPTSLPKLNVKWYANGGFPEDGLFMANHNELVGQFSNGRTAVANNAQIQAGIEEAAYRGFMRAMSQSGGMGGQGGTYKFVAQLNGKTLFEEVVNQNNSTVKSTGNTPLLV